MVRLPVHPASLEVDDSVSGDVTLSVEAQIGTKLALSQHQVGILHKCLVSSGIKELMEIAERSDRTKFRNQVLKPLLNEGFLNMTIPNKPTSSKQEYRLTKKGRVVLDVMEKKGKAK